MFLAKGRGWAIGVVVVSLGICGFGVYNTWIDDPPSAFVSYSVGLGPWVAIVGGVLLLAGGVLGILRR